MHKTIRVQVWANVDEGIADLVLYLNTIEGVTTCASCQGTIGEGGPAPYRAHVMADWPKEVEPRLLEEFDITFEGECWGYIHPREGWVRPSGAPKPDISWNPAAGLFGCATCNQRWGRNAISRCLCGGA